MRIIFDKLDGFKYDISAKEIRTLFQLIPDLTKAIKLVHIQGQEPNKSRFERPARYEILSQRINLSAKGLNKNSIIRELLIELIAHNGNDFSLSPASYKRLTKNQMDKIEKLINPIIEEFKERNKNSYA